MTCYALAAKMPDSAEEINVALLFRKEAYEQGLEFCNEPLGRTQGLLLRCRCATSGNRSTPNP